MTIYRLQSVYLPQGWARDALVTVSDGMITAIETSARTEPRDAEPRRVQLQPVAPQPVALQPVAPQPVAPLP